MVVVWDLRDFQSVGWWGSGGGSWGGSLLDNLCAILVLGVRLGLLVGGWSV